MVLRGVRLVSLAVMPLLALGCAPRGRPVRGQPAVPAATSKPPPSQEATPSAEPVETLSHCGWEESAKLLVDVPIYASWVPDTDEPVAIGRLRKGVEVFVYCRDDDAFVDTYAPFPGSPLPVLPLLDYQDLGRELSMNSLSVRFPKRITRSAESRLRESAQDEWGRYRGLRPEPGGAAFSMLRCGRFQTLHHKQGHLAYVAAEYPAGELWGWVDMRPPRYATAAEASWDEACSNGVPYGSPADYERAQRDTFRKRPLEQRIRPGDEFYLRTEEARGAELCQSVRVASAPHPAKPGLLLHFLEPDGSVAYARALVRHGIRAQVHPYILESDGTLRYTVSGVGMALRAVREDSDSIGFVSFGHTEAEDGIDVFRFDRAALLWWDRSREKCETRLRRR